VPPPEKIAESGMMSNEDDLKAYHAAMTQPGALTAMINYYRANFRFPLKPRIADPRIHVPTLILWGKGDLYLEAALAQRSADLCDDARGEYFDTTHWIQQA
jgi:pimeloyl-ACP methyl ester carboxylesterase